MRDRQAADADAASLGERLDRLRELEAVVAMLRADLDYERSRNRGLEIGGLVMLAFGALCGTGLGIGLRQIAGW